MRSLINLLQEQAKLWPDNEAILAPGRLPLKYSALLNQAEIVNSSLREFALNRHSPAAIVLPNGQAMATPFLSIAASVISAPLNPAYQSDEFDFYLSDLSAEVLIILEGMASPAREVARQRGIAIIELVPDLTAETGRFTLHRDKTRTQRPRPAGFAAADDVALVLHTSGTTSRPKMVPLTHSNLYTSANNIRASLSLSEIDRCLNIMPLFHIHGLIGVVLSSIAAGASVVCTDGFLAPVFYQWLEAFKPTWYSAVPTMQQAILSRAPVNQAAISRAPLRFIRSASAPLPPAVLRDMESALNAPVIEAYGMTEASHQIATNPLPPRQHKPGSVGLAAGTQIAIIDTHDNFLSTGEGGEILITGPYVTAGYANNAEANERAFFNGWLRTGDQGYLDSDGYLFITGRLKELINRAGQKISPREIDEVLLEHPEIAQAITFAVPHATLGEDVAAAIVLKADSKLTGPQIREFAANHLAYYKVPHQIVFLDDLPKGATGKPQRINLAEKLGLGMLQDSPIRQAQLMSPRSTLEATLSKIWSEVLRVELISMNDNFLDLGGDSMLAAQVVSRLRESGWVGVSLVSFLETPTIADMAEKMLHMHSQNSSNDMIIDLLNDLESISDEDAQNQLDS